MSAPVRPAAPVQDALPLPAPAPPRRVPGWVQDERAARAAWSALASAEDRVAGWLVADMGASAALEWVLSGSDALPGVRNTEAAVEVRRSLARWREHVGPLDPEAHLARLHALGGRLLVPGDAQWPAAVDDLGPVAPLCLWVVGPVDLAAVGAASLSLVGARACSTYGARVASEIASGAAARGLAVVSGAALGIDAAAHRGALAAGGTTVALLAGGVDVDYPPQNAGLLERLRAEQAVVSEVPPGAESHRHRFLARNRLVAALGRATVVVEAAWRSGARSTASRAVELLRPLGAVPGRVTSPESAGCHRLMREMGAVCVTDAAEAAELASAVGTVAPVPRAVPAADHDGLDPEQLRVLDALSRRVPRAVELLARTAALTTAEVQARLGALVLAGLAERVDGGYRRRARRA